MIEYFIYSYGSQILMAILCAIMGTLGHGVKKIYQTYVNDVAKQAIARAVVQFVEQAWKHLHGQEKLRKALETAQELLAKKGIDFDADEMTVLIEAALAEFNEAFRKPLKEENAAGTYRVPEAIEDQTTEDIVISGFAGNKEE